MANPVNPQDIIDINGLRQNIAQAHADTREWVSDTTKLFNQLKANSEQLSAEMKKIGSSLQTGQMAPTTEVIQRVTQLTVQYQDQQKAVAGLDATIKTVNQTEETLKKRIDELTNRYNELNGTSAKVVAEKKRIAKELVSLTRDYGNLGKVVKATNEPLKVGANSYTALSKKLNEMRAQLKALDNAFDPATGKLNKFNQEAVDLSRQITVADKALKNMDATMGQFGRNVGNYPKGKGGFLSGALSLASNSLGGSLGGGAEMLLGGAGATASVAAIAAIGVGLSAASVSVAAEYEKLDLLLENSLNNNKKAAGEASKLIKQFAAESPLELGEVTKAFTRLVDIGVIPTKAQLTQLSDLAISKNKTITDYVEAIADAQRGEFERLKEFSVNASKQGDKIIFTFKGVRTEVENNEKAINDYLIGLGKVPGIMGATDKLAGSMAGKWGQLKDALKETANIFGSALAPAIKKILDVTTDAIMWVNNLLTSHRGLVDSVVKNILSILPGGTALAAMYQKMRDEDNRKEELDKRRQDRRKRLNGDVQGGLDEVRAAEEARRAKMEVERKAKEDRKKAADKAKEDEKAKKAEQKLKDDLERIKLNSQKQLAAVEETYKNGLLTEAEYEYERAKLQEETIKKEQARLKQAGLEKTNEYLQTEVELQKTTAEYAGKRKDIADKAAKERKEAEEKAWKESVDALKDALKTLDQETQLGLDTVLADLDAQYERQVGIIQSAVERGAMTERQGNEELYNLKTKYLQAVTDAAVMAANTEIEVAKDKVAALKAVTTDEKRLAELTEIEKGLISNVEADRIKAMNDLKKNLAKEYSDYDVNQTKLAEEEKRNIQQKSFELAQQAVTSFFEITSANREQEIAGLEKQKQRELELAGNNDSAKRAIEERYAAKVKELRRKQAIQDKIQAVFTIGLNTTIGISSALKTPPLIPFIAAIGALQMATALAKPLPEFWKGTKDAPEGPAWVGERGFEIIQSKDKNGKTTMRVAAEKQVTYLNRHDKVFTHEESKKMIEVDRQIAADVRKSSPVLNPGRQLAAMQPPINQGMLVDAFKQAIRELPVTEQYWNERGYQEYQRKEGQRVRELNEHRNLPKR